MGRIKRKMNNWFIGFDENPWDDYEEDLGNYRKAWVDAHELEGEFVITVELPGVEKNDIEVSVEENSLVIKVEKKARQENNEPERGFYSYKQSYAGFYRRIPLPENADVENIDAEYRDGVLKLRSKKLKKKSAKGREISVR